MSQKMAIHAPPRGLTCSLTITLNPNPNHNPNPYHIEVVDGHVTEDAAAALDVLERRPVPGRITLGYHSASP